MNRNTSKERTFLQKSLLTLQFIALLLYVALLISFIYDGAYVALIFAFIGIVGAVVGLYGVYRESFAALMSYTGIMLIWIIIAIIHICILENLTSVKDRLVMGSALSATIADPNLTYTFQVLYPVLYSLSITVSAISLVLACLLPTPEGSGFNYPWLKSKIAMDEYYRDDWGQSQQPGYDPYFNTGMPAPMFLGIPTYPMPPPQGYMQHQQMFRQSRNPASRSLPNVYDARPPHSLPAQRPPSHTGYFSEERSSGSYRHSSRSPPAASQPDRSRSRESRREPEYAGQRRRSSATDNFGFL